MNDRIDSDGVVVVGAGVAGLAAARRLRERGVMTTLLERLPRVGGRAVTARVAGAPFDLGATWLHDADHNPLVAMAAPDDELVDSTSERRERMTIGGRLPSAAEQGAEDAAWAALDRVTLEGGGADTTLACVLDGLGAGGWAPLLALWEGPIIAGADASRLGARDWQRNRLGGRNLIPAAGVGAFVARRLATEAVLDADVTWIGWGGSGVRVETTRGTIRAGAAIVTVSMGVLAAGSIRFDPALPVEVQAAVAALPMGLLSKLALPAVDGGRLGIAPGTVLVDREGCMTFNAWPLGRPYLAGFVGGGAAWAVAGDVRGAEDLARAELGRMLGQDALRGLGPAEQVTGWGTDPAFLGGYAYAGPGDSGQREALAAAFPGECLLFAGEAVRGDGLAGTVGGAWLSGTEAAERLLGGLG